MMLLPHHIQKIVSRLNQPLLPFGRIDLHFLMAGVAKGNSVISLIPVIREAGAWDYLMDRIGGLVAQYTSAIEHIPYQVIVGIRIFNWHKLLPHFLNFVKDNLITLHLKIRWSEVTHGVTCIQEVSGE